ncbi:FAD-dependent oxidoreductase [Aeoliella mucimassa]|uniref:Tricarballylate dehydrogenase n=1 Tax=Aeoliella mucimassa TaxID=2527972 RepID=A0A518AR75_9BACT|nr:FAD-dependent oxidoreductase [Aeoliella mucimassa]QDU57229.1 tricarballylate dehydrogenase [Aeoliella mucimassa]
MKRKTEEYEVVVCGGGLAGFCAAVASARGGASTVLIHNRPVLGGNSSSEIGVTPHGAAAFHAYARETGIISELLIEERAMNHAEVYENGWTNSVWDLVLYNMAVSTANLTVHLNTNIQEVVLQGEGVSSSWADLLDEVTHQYGYSHRPTCHGNQPATIAEVKALVLNAELELTIRGRMFIDCTGDGLVGDRAGCEWRMGSEGREEFNEPHAPLQPSTDTMGSSIHFRAKDLGYPVTYHAPDWAIKHEDASYFYDQGRLPKEERGGYWWLEIGVPYHTIYDNEDIRHELTRHTLGVWDWIKNRDPVMKDRAKNYALDWIGQVPGKRESRRIIGRYFVTEHDVQNRTVFEDEVAFGGWFVDLHTPGGLLANSSEPCSAGEQEYNTFSEYSVKSYCGPYGIPLRCLMAKDATNLLMAGRNISASHAALGTMRVMGTTALMGQACGTAAAYAVRNKIATAELSHGDAIAAIQQTLLREGCFLPNVRNQDTCDLARLATATSSSDAQVSEAGPHTQGCHAGLAEWRDQPQYHQQQLDSRKGQLIAIGHEGIDVVSVCLTNRSGTPQSVEAAIYAVDHVWDYRVEPGPSLATAMLQVLPGEEQWVDWSVQLDAAQIAEHPQYLRLDLLTNPAVEWLTAGNIEPGMTSYYQIGAEKMRRFANGSTLSVRVMPHQSAYPASMVLSGTTRPHRSTNVWRSDPNQPLPQWLDLSWDSVQAIGLIELTFPGHLLREYHAYAPHYRDPQTPADYSIQCEVDGEWQTVATCTDNYQRRGIHRLPRGIETRKLRITVTRTNGDPSAAINEIRCYTDLQ